MVSWKAIPASIIISVLITLVFCYWMQSKADDSDNLSQQIKIIQKEKDSLDAQVLVSYGIIENLNGLIGYKVETIDSLMMVLRRIRRQSHNRQMEIDSLIASDSSRAIQQYRIALETLGVIPDMSARLTLREIGYGAKFLSDYQGMQLQVHLQAEAFNELELLIILKEDVITEQKNIIISKEKKVEQTEMESDLYKAAYEDVTRFMANRIVVVAGGTTVYVNGVFHFGAGVTFGLKLWGNK